MAVSHSGLTAGTEIGSTKLDVKDPMSFASYNLVLKLETNSFCVIGYPSS